MTEQKSRVVLFVGAGASRACGYPLTSDILREILSRLDGDGFQDRHIQKHAVAFKRFLRKLVPRAKTAYLPQITEVLSVIDYCLESGEELYPANSKTLRLAEARWLLERAISLVIRKVHKREMTPRKISDWIESRRTKGADVTIISTNYDFSLDRVLFERLGNWNTNYLHTGFGFTWRDPDSGELVYPSRKPLLRLYKLHGSLNWLGCSRCGYVYVNFMRTVVTQADGTGEWAMCECNHSPLRGVLVAPSFVRRYRDRNLLSIWASAWEALRLADELVFAGYSLPQEDVGIRALLTRAMFARRKRPVVQVISHGDDALPRYRQLFPACRYTGDGLRLFLDGTCQWQEPESPWRR